MALLYTPVSLGRIVRFCRFWAVIFVSFGLSGCGYFLSGAGPYKDTIISPAVNDAPPYSMIDLSASNIAEFMRPPMILEAGSTVATTPASVRLVAGDVLKIMVADNTVDGGVFAPLASGGTIFERVRIGANGAISLPYIGRPVVRGMTLAEVEDLLVKRLKGLASEAQVHVELVGDLSGSILVAGAVKAPGRFSSMEGPLTLLDAVNMAGGPVLEPHLVNVVLRNAGTVQTLAYQDVLNGRNVPLQPGSEIVVERARQRFVAMGAVNDPGLHDLSSSRPSLLEVLGTVGGLRESSANPSGVFVFRLDDSNPETEIAQVFRLDMRRPEAVFLARKFLVRPEDAVYVTNAAVYEWQKIISPIVQTLVLGRMVSGF